LKLLFIHQNAPGQYKYLAAQLAADSNNQVVFITQRGKPDLPGITKIEYTPHRGTTPSIHHYAAGFENAILLGQGVCRIALDLKKQGFYPDVICAHPGWGEALYVKDVFPKAALWTYLEFYYHARNSDVDFLPDDQPVDDDLFRVRTKNAVNLLNLEACDAGVTPTRFQLERHPREYHYKIIQIHEGIDTRTCVPNAQARLQLPNGLVLDPGMEVVTYMARNLEPYRGFPVAMKAIAELSRRRPNAQFVIIGGDEVSYGKKPPEGKTYRELVTADLDYDRTRVHFLGRVPYPTFLKFIQVSSVHLYLTVPFVLSWSMLEAMSAEALVVGSRTAPVSEVIEDGVNGLLADFHDPIGFADRAEQVLDHPDRMAAVRAQARRTIQSKYDLSSCLSVQTEIIRRLARGERPTPDRPWTVKQSAVGT
jgi:glycosyltransferase involved in cell wall biosynthesis